VSTNIIACRDHSEFGQSVLAAGIWAPTMIKAPLVLKHVLEKPPQAKTDFSAAIGLGAQELLLAFDGSATTAVLQKARVLVLR